MKAVDIYNLAKSNNVFNNFLGNKFDKDDIQIIDKMIQFGYNKYYKMLGVLVKTPFHRLL